MAKERLLKHGQAHTRLYKTWINMKNRCYNPLSSHYNDYGGRGILICDRWLNDFETFKDWALANSYNDELTIERINNNSNYTLDNCKWATRIIQARNRRTRNDCNAKSTRVRWDNDRNKWRAYIVIKGKYIWLGRFDTIEEATEARKQAEQKYWK